MYSLTFQGSDPVKFSKFLNNQALKYMNIKYVLVPIFFLVLMHFHFPYFLPNYFNKDLEDMEINIYVTPFGIQSNTRARELCMRYRGEFLNFQKIAVEKQLKHFFFMKDLESTLPPYDIDLSKLNEAEQMELKSTLSELEDKQMARRDLMIKYYENTLETIKSNKVQFNQVFSDSTHHCN